MLRHRILFGGLIGTLGLIGMFEVAMPVAVGQATYPCPTYPTACPTACVPNVGGFGYYPTKWRQWPGEPQLEVTNPRAPGLEVLPTPQGQEEIPVPVAPQRSTGPMEGGFLPPGGTILPPQEQGTQPELPEEPKAPEGDALPGLPVEQTPEVLPGLPEEEKPAEEPKSPSSNRFRPGAPWSETPRPTAAIPFESRKPEQRNTVVLLIDGKPSSGQQADAIATTTPESAAQKGVEAAAYAVVESAASAQASAAAGVDAPRVAIDGYCPIDLVRNGRWTQGDLRYTVVHDGAIYRLSGESQWREFQANPDAFTPAYSGNDPVASIDQQHLVPGKVMYCATYNGRLYMFANPDTQARFNKNPQRYAAER